MDSNYRFIFAKKFYCLAKRVAPQFTRRLDARVCKSGSEITLEVEVGSTNRAMGIKLVIVLI